MVWDGSSMENTAGTRINRALHDEDTCTMELVLAG